MAHRSLRVGARGIVHDALARMHGFGVKVHTREPFPDFPWGFTPPISLDYGGFGDEVHCCRKEPGIIALQGGFVVFDVSILAQCGSVYRTKESFAPFFTREVHIYHDNVPSPDRSIWRPLRGGAAAICCLAQNPWIRSVAFETALSGYNREVAEACVRSDGQIIVRWARNQRHHVAYVRVNSMPNWYWGHYTV